MVCYWLLLLLFTYAANAQTCLQECMKTCVSPPPPSPEVISLQPPPQFLRQKSYMTPSFPLGACSMPSPSLPYDLKFLTFVPGEACFSINLVKEYKKQCHIRNLLDACEDMIVNLNKIVFWYKQVDECGYQQTLSKKSLNVFPWNVRQGSNLVRAGRFRIYPPNSTQAHVSGDLGLFKWEFTSSSKNVSGVEVDINKSAPFKRPSDSDMNGYTLCLVYDPSIMNVLYCITQNYLTKYSFYDPYKKICTQGALTTIAEQ